MKQKMWMRSMARWKPVFLNGVFRRQHCLSFMEFIFIFGKIQGKELKSQRSFILYAHCLLSSQTYSPNPKFRLIISVLKSQSISWRIAIMICTESGGLTLPSRLDPLRRRKPEPRRLARATSLVRGIRRQRFVRLENFSPKAARFR